MILPYTEAELRADALRVYGLDREAVNYAAYSLYDQGFISYPKTVCPYLPEALVGEHPSMVLQEVRYGHFGEAEVLERPEAYDDVRVGAHHGIVPTSTPFSSRVLRNPMDLKGAEGAIYGLILNRMLKVFGVDSAVAGATSDTEGAVQP